MAEPRTWTGSRLRRACLHALLTALLFSASGSAEERLPIKNYTTAEGLAHNTVNRIVRDSRGFLWFCTSGGLSRFDGYSFRNFGAEQGLPHSAVYNLLETRSGEYWVATGAGVVRFDPQGNPDTRAKSGTPMFALVLTPGATGPPAPARALFEDRDRTIWVGTDHGLFRVLPGRRSTLEPVDIGLAPRLMAREVRDILEDSDGTLWMAGSAGLYRRWPDGTYARYTTADGLPTVNLSDLFEDRRGQLWAGSHDAGFFSVTADASHGLPQIGPAFTDGVSTSWVFELYETSTGRFLVGSKGLYEFLAAGNSPATRFRPYGSAAGISDPQVTAFAEDLAGNLWLGTGRSGATRVTRAGFTSFGESDWIKSVGASFEDASGRVCFRGQILGDHENTVFDSKTLDLVRTRPSDYHARYGCLSERGFEWFLPPCIWNFGWVIEGITLRARDGEWWLGTGNGLARFGPVPNFTDLKTTDPIAMYGWMDGIRGEQIYRLFEDSSGNIWISSTSTAKALGLARWNRATGRIDDLEESPGLERLSHVWTARSFAEDKSGNVWIGFDGQLARYSDGKFALFTDEDGVPPDAIREMHLDHAGRLWMTSQQSGLTRADITPDGRPTFTHYSTADGLSSNNLRVITEDRQGYIYTGYGNGLDRLDPATRRVKHFTAADGLAPGLVLSAFRDRDGVLWFGTSNGIARFAPVSEPPTSPPPILITALSVAGRSQAVSAIGNATLALADLATGENELQIDFVGLGFGAGEVLRYEYRLGDTNTPWSAPTERRTITYGSLSPGAYAFEVRAVTSDGVRSTAPATIAFRILPPMWQRWWFVSLAILATALAAYMAMQYRVARLLDVANMRTQIATELHDDIGANLTRIALLSEVAVQKEASPPLTSIARIARESVGAMSDIVWAINPKRETLLDLTRRMRQHADELFTLRGIDLSFTATGGADSRRLTADLRRDLLLTFKEAVHNAARHSGCSAVEISLLAERKKLTLVVSDNGRGFDPMIESEGQGLTNMRKRAVRLNGDLEIRTALGQGTTLTLRVPS